MTAHREYRDLNGELVVPVLNRDPKVPHTGWGHDWMGPWRLRNGRWDRSIRAVHLGCRPGCRHVVHVVGPRVSA